LSLLLPKLDLPERKKQFRHASNIHHVKAVHYIIITSRNMHITVY